MIRINTIRNLTSVAALLAFAAVGCTQSVVDDVGEQDVELRPAQIVDVGNAVSGASVDDIGFVPPATGGLPSRRLGPQPDPWNPEDGPQPDPWKGGSSDGSGSGGGGSPAPSDPSNPNK